MGIKSNTLELEVLDSDLGSPASGELWYSTSNGLGPKASQAASGFMHKDDKTKLDNMSANGSGDDWVSGLVITAKPSPDQTVAYTSGVVMINGVNYTVTPGANYNLANGYGGVNHYTALSASQRSIVAIYVDTDHVIKSVAGAASGDPSPPMPSLITDTVWLAFIVIAKHSNGSPYNITPPDIMDCRVARRASVDEAAKISINDTSSGFLHSKLTDNGNVHFTKENADANESLKADVQFGATSTTACVGNDSRLSDNRVASGLKTATTVVSVSAAAAPIAGKVLTATNDSTATWQTPSGSADANAVHVNAASEISGITEKTAPVAADLIIIEDSAAANAKKRVQIGNLPHASSEATATGTTTTTSSTYAQMASMTLTPGAGTYLCLFSTSLSCSASNGEINVSLFSNSVQIASTESKVSLFKAGDIVDMALNKVVVVAAGQVIEVKWKVASGTATAYARVLTLVKIG